MACQIIGPHGDVLHQAKGKADDSWTFKLECVGATFFVCIAWAPCGINLRSQRSLWG
jgi:hypothetical protein